MFELSLKFNQVGVKQKKNICKSRLDVNIRSEVIRDIYLDIPLIASNMSTVCNRQFCELLHNLGSMGVMHRAADEQSIIHEVNLLSEKIDRVAVSVGIGPGQLEFAHKLIRAGANIIFIDVAHGYSDEVIELGKQIKGLGVKVVLGNTTNIEMLYEADFADAIKVGIAQGFACETRNTAGCTEGQFSAVFKFKKEAKKLGMPIISDGSIKEPADLTKAIGAGANSAMCGYIFARCPESAAEKLPIEGKIKKIYAGMASRYVQNRWKGGLKDGTCPEGKVIPLDIGESAEALLERYSGALKSGITYAGGRDIRSFQDNVEFVRLI